MVDAAEFPPALALTAEPARRAAMRARLGALGEPPYVGVTWRAGLERKGRVVLAKALDAQVLGRALAGVEATLVSLQRGPREGELAAFAAGAGRALHDAAFANDDLEDALALLDLLDEYAGVSNTNTHLRAGLGKSARVLVAWPPEWRWLERGASSPWFAAMPLYRQAAGGSWDDALARLAADLGAYNSRSR
jgi:hypothetical protein